MQDDPAWFGLLNLQSFLFISRKLPETLCIPKKQVWSLDWKFQDLYLSLRFDWLEDLDWSSPSRIAPSDAVSESRELYSSPQFWEVIFQLYISHFIVLNFYTTEIYNKAAAELIIQTY